MHENLTKARKPFQTVPSDTQQLSCARANRPPPAALHTKTATLSRHFTRSPLNLPFALALLPGGAGQAAAVLPQLRTARRQATRTTGATFLYIVNSAMADGAGAEGGGPFDPLPLPDNFEDVLHLLDLSGLNNAVPVPPPPPAAAPVHNVDHTACSRGCSGDDLLDWSAMLDNYPIRDGAPIVTATPPSGLPVHGGPSTSTSSAAQQADVLDCTGCQVLREVAHSNGRYIHLDTCMLIET